MADTEIGISTTQGGPYSIDGRTADKTAASYLVNNLLPRHNLLLRCAHPYASSMENQQNDLLSAWSQRSIRYYAGVVHFRPGGG